jgi:CubicO group peptidase (beta-lactamase class C family)
VTLTGVGLAADVDAIAAETGFSGVVRVDRAGRELFSRAYGLADRAHEVPMTPDTRLALASGAKGFTALTVMRLVEDGVLTLGTRARALLGDDLPLVDDAVTVEQLLAHRSGIGDYLDEDELDDPTDYVLTVPVHTLTGPESYLPELAGHPQKFPPDEGFSYCNGGYVLLALLAERAAGTPFHDLVARHVLGPAGLARTAYLWADELPGDAALGYLHQEGLRTNVLHLPVVGGGDGGIWTTAADVSRLWAAFDAGRIVSPETRAEMLRVRSTADDGDSYGLGFWRREDRVYLVGSDAGVSFRTVHLPGGFTSSVLANTTTGAWPMAKRLDETLAAGRAGR